VSWFVYLLECEDGSIYTGIATNVEKRFISHCKGTGARYTRSHKPLRILACIPCEDRSSASKEEYRIKKLRAADKRLLCAAYAYSSAN